MYWYDKDTETLTIPLNSVQKQIICDAAMISGLSVSQLMVFSALDRIRHEFGQEFLDKYTRT